MTTNIETSGFNQAKILVVGDVMLDQYWHGGTTRISPEAPVPVVKISKTENRLGGAANVATNLLTLGCKPKLLGIVGQDPAADILTQLLSDLQLEHELFRSEQFSTIVKLRVLCRHQQMIRLDHEEDPETISAEVLKNIHDSFAHEIKQHKLVILSDYAKGVLTNPQPYILAANALGIPVVIDPKNRDFKVYAGAQVVKPNLNEFEAIVGKCKNLAILEERARGLIASSGIESLIITRGAQGITVVTREQPVAHFPAYGGEVYDVTGAGDTVISVVAAGLAAGMDLLKAVHLSTVAAGIVVGKVGTSSVTVQEIREALAHDKELPQGATDVENLQRLIKLSQARGEKVVFVNGCYDILHYGHIRYLERAKALGDRLVVGVNTDESVKMLKGDSRPMYNLEQRIEVLAGLKAVDWVVPFAESTPGKLVELLTPDIIAKGDENFKTIEQIPPTEGVEHVLRNGGSVHLISRTEGCSSTKMIEFLASE